MLFADWSTTEVGGLLIGMTGLATAIGAIGKSWMESRHKNKMEEKSLELKQNEIDGKERLDNIETTVRHWTTIATWQKGELERQKVEIIHREAQVKEVQSALQYCNQEHARAREEVSDMYHHMERMHDFSVRVATCCRDLGKDPGPVPEKPGRPARVDANMEFRVRTVEQNAKLIETAHEQPGVNKP